MKKLLSGILGITMFASMLSGLAAAQSRHTYEYVLPAEYISFDFNDDYDVIIAQDKNEKYALYDYNGKKLSGDYDYMVFSDRWFIWAKRDGVDYILSNGGGLVHTFDKRVIGITDYFVLVNLSDANNDGRPMRYYEGEFAICNTNGEQRAVRSYDNHVRPMSFQWGLEFTDAKEAGFDGLMVFHDNGKYGAINEEFETVIEPEFEFIYKFFRGVAIARKDGKYGIIDKSGNTKVDFVYDEMLQIPEGYLVSKDGLYGVISSDGTVILDAALKYKPEKLYPEYKLVEVSAENTREDREQYNNLYGLVDYDGNIVLPVEHTNIRGIGDDRISANKAYDKGGVYDLDGNEITDFKYRMISTYSDGIAFGSGVDSSGEWFNEAINTNGEVVFEPDDYSNGYRNGLALVNNEKLIDHKGNAIIDFSENDNISITSTYFWENSGDKMIMITSGNYHGLIKYIEEPEWDYEYIDFENVKTFVEKENGWVFTTLDDKEFYIDREGNVTNDRVGVTGFNQYFDSYTKNTILYDNHNNKITEFLNEDYFVNESFKDYIAVVSNDVWENKTLRIYCKETGELTLNTKLSEYLYSNINGSGTVNIFDDGTFICCTDDFKLGISDVYGNIITKPEFDLLRKYKDRYFGYKDGAWGYYNSDNSLIKSLDLLEPETFGDSEYVILKNGKISTVCDYDLNPLLEINDYIVREIPCSGAVLLCKSDSATGEPSALMNINGEMIISDSYYIGYLGNGLFNNGNRDDNGKIIRIDGKVIAENCNYITEVGDNGTIGISTDNFEGYINTDGEKVLELMDGYLVQGAFSGGLAPVVKNDIYSRYGETAYINEQGKIMLAPTDKTWYKGGKFGNGIFEVGIALGKAGTQGKNLVRCVFNEPSDWAKESVETAINLGLLSDELQSRYRKNIKRQTFCEIVYELSFIKEATSQPQSFTDTKNEKIEHLAGLGIINGVGEGLFAPDSFITRQEAATILSRIAGFAGMTVDSSSDLFADDAEIADWAKESVYKMKNSGIMNGMGENTFAPAGSYTTEQAIATIVRLNNQINE